MSRKLLRQSGRLQNAGLRLKCISMLLALSAGVLSGAAATKFTNVAIPLKSVTPASGSEISEFNVQYTFDLSGVIAVNGDEDWRLCTYGSGQEYPHNTELWEGDADTGKLLYRAYENTIGRAAPEAGLNGVMSYTFGNITPKEGVKYTVITRNPILAIAKDYQNWTDSFMSSYIGGTFSKKVENSYVGKEIPDTECAYLGTVLPWKSPMYTLTSYDFKFNAPVTIASTDEKIKLTKSNNRDKEIECSYSIKVSESDPTIVTVTFDDIDLDINQTYLITLPEGLVANAANPASKSKEITGCVIGDYPVLEKGEYVSEGPVFDKLSYKLNIPSGVTVPSSGPLISIYKKGNTDGTALVNVSGKYNESTGAFDYDLQFLTMTPATEYDVVLKSGKIYLNGGDIRSGTYIYPEDRFSIRSVSMEEFKRLNLGDMPAFKWGNAYRKKFDYKNPDIIASGEKLEALPAIYLALEGHKVQSPFSTQCSPEAIPGKKVHLIEIKDGEERIVRSLDAKTVKVEDMTTYFYMANISYFNYPLLEGRTYKILVEEGAFGLAGKNATNKKYAGYTPCPEFTMTFEGATPSRLTFAECNIEDDSQSSSIGQVRLKMNGTGVLKENARVYLSFKNAMGTTSTKSSSILASAYSGGQTVVYADFSDVFSGEPYTLNKGWEYTLKFDEGLLVNTNNEEVISDPVEIKITGIAPEDEPKPELPKAEMVNVAVAVNGLSSFSVKSEKGEPFTLTLLPDENWEVKSLKRDGSDVTPFITDAGEYVTPQLDSDTEIKAEIGYAGQLSVADSSGIAVLPESDVKIASSGEEIVITGLQGGERITVYSIAGIVILNHTATQDVVKIHLERGQYIVRVNDEAAKLNH